MFDHENECGGVSLCVVEERSELVCVQPNRIEREGNQTSAAAELSRKQRRQHTRVKHQNEVLLHASSLTTRAREQRKRAAQQSAAAKETEGQQSVGQETVVIGWKISARTAKFRHNTEIQACTQVTYLLRSVLVKRTVK